MSLCSQHLKMDQNQRGPDIGYVRASCRSNLLPEILSIADGLPWGQRRIGMLSDPSYRDVHQRARFVRIILHERQRFSLDGAEQFGQKSGR